MNVGPFLSKLVNNPIVIIPWYLAAFMLSVPLPLGSVLPKFMNSSN